MKILHIVPRFFPHIGGIQYVVNVLAEGLRKAGHEVTIFALEPSIKAPYLETKNKIRIIKWPEIIMYGGFYTTPYDMSSLNSLIDYLAKEHDIIHVHSIHSILSIIVLYRLSRKSFKIPLIFSPHYIGRPSWRYPIRRSIFNLLKMFIKQIDFSKIVMIFSSKWEKESFVNTFYSKHTYYSYVIPYPLADDVWMYKWQPPCNHFILMKSGRMDLRQKRFDLLIYSYAILKKTFKTESVKLVLIGNGPHKGKIINLAKKLHLKIGEDIHILPPLPRSEYLEMLSRSSLYITISEGENFGLAPREAIAMGVPTIVSNNTALSELVELNLAEGIERNDVENILYVLYKILVMEKKNFSKIMKRNFIINQWKASSILPKIIDVYYKSKEG